MKFYSLAFLFFFSIFCFGINFSGVEQDSVGKYTKQQYPLKTLEYYRKVSGLFLSNKEYDKYCDVILKKADLHKTLNDHENAFKALFDAKKIAEENNLTKKIVLITTKISLLYLETFEFKKSKKYLKEAEKLAVKSKDNVSLESIYYGYFLYHFKTDSDSTTYYIEKKNKYFKYIKDPNLVFKHYSSLTAYYLSKNNTNLFLKYSDSALQIAKKLKDKNKISSVKHNIGYHYMVNLKDYSRAKKEYLEILNMFSPNENLPQISDTYLNLSFAYEKLGDYKNALDITNKYLESYEQILEGKLADRTKEIETKYYIDKAENEFNKKNKFEKEKNQKLIVVIASLFILAGLIFYFYYQNLLLNQKNKLKEIDSKLQFKIISATLDGQDQERNKISSVLHDNVSAILSSVGLHLSAFESNLTDNQIKDLKKTRELLRDAHDKVRDLSHQLVPPLLVKFGLSFALNDLCEKNSNSILKMQFVGNNDEGKRYHQEFETKIYFIVSEIFNNIMKHSKASLATLLIEEKDDKLHLIITDNGKGFDVKNISASNGFGLTQIKARIKNMNGKFSIKSKINQGTSIEIELQV